MIFTTTFFINKLFDFDLTFVIELALFITLAIIVTFHDTAWPNWLLPSLPRSTGREGKETVDEPLIIRVS